LKNITIQFIDRRGVDSIFDAHLLDGA
jgi:hypothetical protein